MAVERIDTVIDLDSKNDVEDKKELATNGSSSEGDELDIEIVDDTPEQDRNRPLPAPGTKSAVPSDEEIGEYTKGVQDRIKQIKWEYHNERRAKEAWERQSNAAIEYAKKVHAENERLRKLVSEGHKTLLDSTKAAAEGEISALQESLKSALETGNTALAADLQTKISRAAARAEAQSHIAPITFEKDEGPDKAVPQQQREDRPQVRLSKAMQDWMDENPWFNENKRMTAFAFGVHEELIAKGIPVESPRYFQEINKAVRGTFSDYFETDNENEDDDRTNRRPPAQRRRTPVAGVTRTNTSVRGNKVTLTQSELAVAKRMGIPPAAYAREKQRLEQLDNG